MHPVLFTIGNISIYAYGASIIIGLLFCSFLFYWLSSNQKLNTKLISDHLFIIFLSTLFMSRLFHILFQYKYYSENIFSIFFITDGGLSLWGAILGGYLSIKFLIRMDKKNISKWMDICSLTFLFLSSFIYLGQFGQGSGIGKTTDFFLGVYIDNINSPYVNVPVHPTSLYMSLLSLLSLLILLWIFISKKYPYLGFIYQLSMITFSMSIIITESLRWDVSYWMYNYNIDKTIGILVIVLFSVTLLYSTWQIYDSKFKKKN